VLLGATGTGKSATTAWLIERLQRPTLVMAPNKTLAAQLANELREMLPHNAVEYFVSYYDYYQPEAYIAQTDTYIEKDSSINDDVERLRHSATSSLLSRRDVVVVASVSCIYGLGTPQSYLDRSGAARGHRGSARRAAAAAGRRAVQPQRHVFHRGSFRVRGDTVEIIPSYEELAVRIEYFGDEIEALYYLHPLTGDVVRRSTRCGSSRPRTTWPDRSAWPRPSPPSRRNWRSGWATWRAGQAAGGAAAADAHQLRHRDDAPGRLLLRHRELLPHIDGRPAARPPRCSTTSPTTSCW
jgi:excinuclease UvrABC helicase subunit UvrB